MVASLEFMSLGSIVLYFCVSTPCKSLSSKTVACSIVVRGVKTDQGFNGAVIDRRFRTFKIPVVSPDCCCWTDSYYQGEITGPLSAANLCLHNDKSSTGKLRTCIVVVHGPFTFSRLNSNYINQTPRRLPSDSVCLSPDRLSYTAPIWIFSSSVQSCRAA